MLAAAYSTKRTGDLSFVKKIWLNIKVALRWIDESGDRDQDGFVSTTASRRTGSGPPRMKDSNDSVFHANGELAQGPIALCEVQGYVYAAKKGAAELARALEDLKLAEVLESQAASRRRASTKFSGVTTWESMLWPWTATSSLAGSAPRMRVTVSTRESLILKMLG